MEELKRVPFSTTELENNTTDVLYGFCPVRKFNTPISMRDNYAAAMDHKIPLWMPSFNEGKIFVPRENLDNICRGMPTFCGTPPAFGESLDGEDVFGVPWIFIPSANGSIEDPSKPPILNDMSEWKEKLTFPDPDKWDWKGSAERNKEYLSGGYYNILWQCCGFRERITSLLGFEECLMEFIDEDMQPHIHSFFEQMVEFYKKIIRNSAEHYNIDMFFFHDDWGTQRASFMNPNTTREMIAPYLKQLVDYTHQCGLKFQLHSCGCNMQNVEIMIECGVDTYGPQRTANDVDELYRRYGDQIILGIAPDIAPDATDAEVRDFAKKFMDKYGPDYAKKPIYMEDAFFAPYPATLREYVYEESRKGFNP